MTEKAWGHAVKRENVKVTLPQSQEEIDNKAEPRTANEVRTLSVDPEDEFWIDATKLLKKYKIHYAEVRL